MKIWFATNNSHKKRELEAILGTVLYIPSENNLSFNPDETGDTFAENALLKARELKKLLNKEDAVIADDSGICIDALNGRPGVLSARYGMKNGIELESSKKNLMILGELGNSKARSARFVCAMVLLHEENRFVIAQETIEGEIVKDAASVKGEGGFGFDPVFFIPHLGKTMAELSEAEKNAISHRGKAGKIIKELLMRNEE